LALLRLPPAAFCDFDISYTSIFYILRNYSTCVEYASKKFVNFSKFLLPAPKPPKISQKTGCPVT
ncbi:MAG: hypothetical protein ACYST6_20480, partial [Planctomycetota bacterium]